MIAVLASPTRRSPEDGHIIDARLAPSFATAVIHAGADSCPAATFLGQVINAKGDVPLAAVAASAMVERACHGVPGNHRRISRLIRRYSPRKGNEVGRHLNRTVVTARCHAFL